MVVDSPDYFIGVAQQALWVVSLAVAPILIPALIAGVVLGMIQAATSINEATLSFVPKLIVVGLCLILFGSAILMLLMDFTQDIFARIPDLTR
ncbi:flagellar biosynthesis protein FliQ [Allosphingosinicella flava]|uniref:Flagellar biosynthetic protein FliQ n=1 Tax=Allosphingosinicella flava TaxID=2771430 RepID=A0A7T2LMB2_9SPHN|nr:flagellar biosynthesis protein FliQ [Sphingosinicella flava]QPQ55361.1 flagellar biosynthesis protein FliQ [Sphingosinicella flava]